MFDCFFLGSKWHIISTGHVALAATPALSSRLSTALVPCSQSHAPQLLLGHMSCWIPSYCGRWAPINLLFTTDSLALVLASPASSQSVWNPHACDLNSTGHHQGKIYVCKNMKRMRQWNKYLKGNVSRQLHGSCGKAHSFLTFFLKFQVITTINNISLFFISLVRVIHSCIRRAVSCNPGPFHDTWKKMLEPPTPYNKISFLIIHIQFANMIDI